jgi:hypothetical protein
MFFKLSAAAGIAVLLSAVPAAAGQANHEMKPGCCDMPCCADHAKAPASVSAEPDAIGLLGAAGRQVVPAEKPARQASDVWFMQPVRVGRSILQGHYVIEHDNDRMARGEPCTYIYAFNDRTKPVVTFNCTHLERERATKTIAVVQTKGDIQVLTEFQFSGDTEAHGVPDR